MLDREAIRIARLCMWLGFLLWFAFGVIVGLSWPGMAA